MEVEGIGMMKYVPVSPSDLQDEGEGEGGGDDFAMQDAQSAKQFKDAVDAILACGLDGIA